MRAIETAISALVILLDRGRRATTMSAPVRTESTGPLVTGVAVGFLSAAAVFMALRFYTRGAILKNIGKDDWTMLVALVRVGASSLGGGLHHAKHGHGRRY
jgi:hypothetical protein